MAMKNKNKSVFVAEKRKDGWKVIVVDIEYVKSKRALLGLTKCYEITHNSPVFVSGEMDY